MKMKTTNLLAKYKNGNAAVQLLQDGTRIVEYDGELDLDYPLNVDVRVSSKCTFGMNPKTGKAVCAFCHESATTDGVNGDVEELHFKLSELPIGTEIAIGANQIDKSLFALLFTLHGRPVNLTVNQGHLPRDCDFIKNLIKNGLIRGLGVSYRHGMAPIPQEILEYPNTVVHVIAGIDDIHDVKRLASIGVKKLLVLGEKDFGFNQGRVDLQSHKHQFWRMWVHDLFEMFDVVSFDNLALEQLRVGRFVPQSLWDKFYQGEHSLYINAVDGTYSPSSRSPDKTPWDGMSIKEYFQSLKKQA